MISAGKSPLALFDETMPESHRPEDLEDNSINASPNGDPDAWQSASLGGPEQKFAVRLILNRKIHPSQADNISLDC